MPLLLELSESQKRQYIDAETVFTEWHRVRAQAASVRGSMFWREQNGHRYLIRASAAGHQKSLGPDSPENQQIHDRFQARKASIEQRLSSLGEALKEQQRLNKALRVGRVPSIVVKTLNALEDAGLQDHFLTIGTHALYAYESACGVRFMPQAMATQDIDLLFDTRKRISFFSRMKRLDTSLISALRKADPTFLVKPEQKHTAINATGFEVDVVRRMAGREDPHPLRMSSDEDDFWAVQIDTGERILGADRFSQMVVSATGHMAFMHTMHPLTFVRVKRIIAATSGREPLKKTKDILQADLIEGLIESHMPQYRTRSN